MRLDLERKCRINNLAEWGMIDPINSLKSFKAANKYVNALNFDIDVNAG